MTHAITDSPQGMVPVLSLRDLSELASEVPIVASGVASLRMSLTPNPTAVEPFVRDPADLLNLIGALDLRAAGEPIVVYLGVGLGAGPYYRVPSVVVNSNAGIAVRMAMGIDVEVAPRLSLGAAVDAVGLFRAQRDAWSLIATDSAQRGASLLPVHARLRLLL